MKRQKLIVSLVVTVLVGFGIAAVTASAQKPQSKVAPVKPEIAQKLESHGLDAGEMEKAKRSVERPSASRMFAVVEEFNGSFKDVDAHLASFQKEFTAQGLNKSLKANPTAILIIHEDPTGKASFRMAIGLELPVKLAAKAPLKTEELNEPQAAHYTHVGAYERLKNVHDGIDEHARAEKSRAGRGTRWPVILRLLSDPKKTPAGQLQTEMIVPL